jgi:hypothetical protein
MKWFNRIAQGFSPGKMDRRDRPERAAELGSNIGIRLFGVGRLPRAKALGYSLGPFHGQKFAAARGLTV